MENIVVVQGRMVRDPELRRTAGGTAVCSFTLACERDFKDDQGKKETDFLDVVAWRQTAEFVAKYFRKGRMVLVRGRLQLRDWTDKDGNKRRNAEILADKAYFCDTNRETPQELPAQGFAELVDEEDGELPF